MLDIDYFKDINDTHGHLAGDQILIELVRSTKRIMRANDIIARFGGEEFVILLPDTETKGALAFAEKIQAEISTLSISAKNGERIPFTISIGISEYKKDNDIDAMLQQADVAMYKAKTAGRNRIVCH